MLDWIGEFICDFVASFIPWRVWLVLAVVVGLGALLVVLLSQPG